MPTFYTRYWGEMCVVTRQVENENFQIPKNACVMVYFKLPVIGLGERKFRHQFPVKKVSGVKFIFVKKQNSLITPLAVCASLLKKR